MSTTSIAKDKQKPNQGQAFGGGEPYILIKGAREHNLQNIDVKIPKSKLVVVTGVSGSGKSSLIMDTLYAEGQRRYVESLSSYARQFLVRMEKPEVDYITGLCPAIAIEQKVTTRTSRSTVGSLTEIYDYLKLLFARIGTTISPISGEEVRKHSVSDVVDFILTRPLKSKIQLLAPFALYHGRGIKAELDLILQKGFSRVLKKGESVRIEDLLEQELSKVQPESISILVDRFVIKEDSMNLQKRMADSVQTALFEGDGTCQILVNNEVHEFSNRFELDGMAFEEPTPEFFSFNSPYGACKRCEGFGSIIGIDDDLVFPDKELSVYDDGVACWRGEKMQKWKERLVRNADKFDFPIHRSIKHLTDKEYELLWEGNEYFRGLHEFFRHLEEKSYKIQYRVMLSRYRGRTLCPECRGTRVRKDANYVKVGGKSITDLILMPLDELSDFFETLDLKEHQKYIAKRVMLEINNRLQFMLDVGLGYLTLNRLSNTLSGGETQRINLTRTLGSNLTSSLYILDEPSIGLHSKDNHRLVKVLKRLRDMGNTVIVVEHDEEIMREADYILDLGPEAGIHGGHLVSAGTFDEIIGEGKSLTAKYLGGQMEIEVPIHRRKASSNLMLKGARQHNLKGVDMQVPLNSLVLVTGVSGSGKTTLVKSILVPALQQLLQGQGSKPGMFDDLEGDWKQIDQVELVDQNPIGRSSRSNPVTYVKAFDAIRELFSKQQPAKLKGLKPKHFSFNVEGGRCENCKGEGEITVEMQFLADIHLTCETCNGQRFKEEVLDVTYNGKSIYDVLEMSVEEALEFFSKQKDITDKLQPLFDVGLGYVKLGQSSNTLSGGEAQRVKLAHFLSKGRSQSKYLFVFDEPTTGLHFHDIKKLLAAFNALIEQGHSIIVIEHNLEVIKSADWIVDMGPDGGKNGGEIVFQGVPEELIKKKKSHTGAFLKEKLSY